ncbi:four-carbon acid sugar kinase family protein [Agromyces mediolanus]|uniref:3-oxo-tetronate kinase n=1 Tax=Agromyces mediolanus TaxID=41986 RepID=UPI00203E39AC|nr:3-oxo-tetronate kinase [Agromyces mediolanus]MCM3658259.1 four-carbon acid sugar kinase family protein [Agromyces mediolanus]
MSIALGVVADDLTGACDVAAGLATAGLDVDVLLGVPGAQEPPTGDVAIVALKSRTAPTAEAVGDSTAAARALRRWGAERLYQKYCSTFDSTRTGNIGPVADAFGDLGVGPTIGTPATPTVGRSMYDGHLFVDGRLLSESPLAQHPLTPMRDPDLVRVLGRQTDRPVALVRYSVVRNGAVAIAEALRSAEQQGAGHVLVDALDDEDLDALAAALDSRPGAALGGAAGLAAALGRRLSRPASRDVQPPPEGRCLILVGSASQRTARQLAAYGGPTFAFRAIDAISAADETADAAIEAIRDLEHPLVAAQASPDEVAEAQRRFGVAESAAAIERLLARIASRAVADLGVRRVLVAGGETSGAVITALGVSRLRVRRVVDPGVPWMSAEDRGGRSLDLCLKSGNFGSDELFLRAWEEVP